MIIGVIKVVGHWDYKVYKGLISKVIDAIIGAIEVVIGFIELSMKRFY